MGYLHPETSQVKVVIDRLNQQKYLMLTQPQNQPQWSRGMVVANRKLLIKVVSAEGIEPSTY